MSARSLFSPVWYRVAELRPRLRAHAQLHRQHYRGDLWYVLQDHASGKFYRFSPAAQAVIGLMDGRRTMQEIWDLVGTRLGDGLPTQDETIQLLSQLHAADMLHADSVPDVREIADRSAKQKRRKLLQNVRNPLGIRFSLFDPDRFLTATAPAVRPLFGWFGLLLWLGMLVYGLILAGIHWQALTENAFDRVLAAENLLLLLISYPLVKALHELGHGYAVKVWGGAVHDMGIMLMVFVPIPYVDASAASAFRERHRRVVVGAAGIMVELFLAALAMVVWVNVEPGFVRALAFNVMLIGGVSTVLFNGNPLLRFDGYYILADLIEVPNLGARSNRYLGYFCRRYLFGVSGATSPVTARGERAWLTFYAAAAFAYRMVIMVGIVLIVAAKFFFVGVALAVWSLVLMLVMPVAKGLAYLLTAQELARNRTRAVVATAALVAAIAGPLCLLPIPYGTVAEGTVWLPDRARVHAGTDGFVAKLAVAPGMPVGAGQPLLVMEDPILAARTAVLEARLNENQVRLAAEEVQDLVAAEITREQLKRTTAELAYAREQLAALTVLSPGTGRFLARGAEDLEGRFLRKGELVGYVLDPAPPVVRVVVRQDDITLVRARTEGIEVRFADAPLVAHPAHVLRATPQATDRLPSPALATEGGGGLLLDPASDGQRVLESVFVIDLAVEDVPPGATFGGRVHARFDHGTATVAAQAYRAVRQLLLRRFDW